MSLSQEISLGQNFKSSIMANLAPALHSNSSISLTELAYLSRRNKSKWRNYFKLIDLYKHHECLWMENHKDFCNFALKEEIWDTIADEMTSPANPEPTPDRWKRLVLTWRYKVQMEQLQQQEAKFYNRANQLPPKLIYSDKFQFLIKHMFDRTKPVKKVVKVSLPEIAPVPAVVPKISLSAKYMRLGRSKNPNRQSFGHKLQTLESLRNRRRSTLSLTPEAFQQLP